MNALRLAIAAVIAVFAMSTAQAQAAGYQEVFKGVANGYDSLGLFGSKGIQFSNTPFELVFSIDTTKGSLSTGSKNQTVNGGTYYSYSNPVTATLKIGNGNAVIFGSTGYYSEAETGVFTSPDGKSYGKMAADIVDKKNGYTFDLSASIISMLATGGFPTRFGQSFSTQAGQSYSTDGSLSVWYGNSLLECISLSPISATAPEPGAWILMLGGVGLMGLALRRRRDLLQPAAC